MAMGSQATISAYMDSSFITADEYNAIKCFTAEPHFGHENIRALGEIILRHGVQDRVGALYVHRHFEMPPDSVVVKYALSDDIEIARMCQIDSLERKDLNGSSFRLLEGRRFQAFEYAVNTPIPPLPQPFLEEFSQFLANNDLDDVLGLFIRAPSNELKSCEMNVEEARLSVVVPLDDVPDDVRLEATPAAWVYPNRPCDDPEAVNSCSDAKVRCDHSTQPDGDIRLLEFITNAFQKRGLNAEISLFNEGQCT